MNTEIVNLDAELAEAPSNTLRNMAIVVASVAAAFAGVLGASALRGTWPSLEALIAGAIGTAFGAWVFAKRSNDGWRVPTVVGFIGTFVAVLLILLGVIGMGTTPAAIPLVIAGSVILIASFGCFVFILMTQ